MWIKSNSLGSQVQLRTASSISNRTFGGTHSGWQGERSVPTISTLGKRSANSLMVISNLFRGGYSELTLPIYLKDVTSGS